MHSLLLPSCCRGLCEWWDYASDLIQIPEEGLGVRGLFCPEAVVSGPLETAIGMCKRATASPISGEVPGSSACPRNSSEVTLQAHSQLGTSLSSCRERGREAEFAARGALGAEAQAARRWSASLQTQFLPQGKGRQSPLLATLSQTLQTQCAGTSRGFQPMAESCSFLAT